MQNLKPYSHYLLYKPSQREVNFILYRLNVKYGDITFPNNLDYLNAYLYNYEKVRTNPIDNVYFNPKRFLVSDESINWLDSFRASIWFYSYIKLEQKYLFVEMSEYGDFKKDLIMSFDLSKLDTKEIHFGEWKHTFNKKKYALNFARVLFNELKTKPKHLSWLCPKDEEQLKWAIEYLDEKDRLIKPPTFSPSTNKSYYSQICASLDALDLFELSTEFKKIDDDDEKLYQDSLDDNNSNEGVNDEISESEQCSDFEFKGSAQTTMHTDYVGQLYKNPNSSIQNPKTTDNIDSISSFKAIYNESEISDYLEGRKHPYKNYFLMSEYKKEFLKNMRNSWNQKSHRDRPKNKSQTKLPYGCNKLLKGIAQAYGENDLDRCLKQILEQELVSLKE